MDNKNILTMAGKSKSLITIDNWCYEVIHQFNNFKKAASYCKENASKLNIILSIKRIDNEWFVLKRSFDYEEKIRNPATARTRIQTPKKNSYKNSYNENSVINSISRGLSHDKELFNNHLVNVNRFNISTSMKSSEGTCYRCNGDGGINGGCFKCDGTGWIKSK